MHCKPQQVHKYGTHFFAVLLYAISEGKLKEIHIHALCILSNSIQFLHANHSLDNTLHKACHTSCMNSITEAAYRFDENNDNKKSVGISHQHKLIMAGNIAKRWRQLHGENHWKDLLDPLDIDLRRHILHYGDLTQASYDTFNHERASKFCGTSRYAKADLFSKVGLVINQPLMKYQVTKFLYATSEIPLLAAFFLKSLSREAWSKESNWIGYVAVATDEGVKVLGRRDIVVVWRGTVEPYEWLVDVQFALVSDPKLFTASGLNPMLHQGWHSIYTSDDPQSPYNKQSARDQVMPEIQRLVELHKGDDISITITGHSLGASLATLNAADIVASGIIAKTIPVTAFSFACCRVGNMDFKQICSQLPNLRVLRITNEIDLIPNYPLLGYGDIGEELRIDTMQSPYIKKPGTVSNWHNMQAYLHGVAGTQGSKGGFKLEIQRDISLLNRTIDALKEDHCVPKKWWVEKNNGMVQHADGSWALDDNEEIQIET